MRLGPSWLSARLHWQGWKAICYACGRDNCLEGLQGQSWASQSCMQAPVLLYKQYLNDICWLGQWSQKFVRTCLMLQAGSSWNVDKIETICLDFFSCSTQAGRNVYLHPWRPGVCCCYGKAAWPRAEILPGAYSITGKLSQDSIYRSLAIPAALIIKGSLPDRQAET